MSRRDHKQHGEDLPWYYQQTAEQSQADHTRMDDFTTHSRTPPTSQSRADHKQQPIDEQQAGESQSMPDECAAAEASTLTEISTLQPSIPSPTQINPNILLSPQLDPLPSQQQASLLAVPSVSVELWTTPNTSPSSSLTTEQLEWVESDKVGQDGQIMISLESTSHSRSIPGTVSCDDRQESVSQAKSDSGSSVSSDMNYEEASQDSLVVGTINMIDKNSSVEGSTSLSTGSVDSLREEHLISSESNYCPIGSSSSDSSVILEELLTYGVAKRIDSSNELKEGIHGPWPGVEEETETHAQLKQVDSCTDLTTMREQLPNAYIGNSAGSDDSSIINLSDGDASDIEESESHDNSPVGGLEYEDAPILRGRSEETSIEYVDNSSGSLDDIIELKQAPLLEEGLQLGDGNMNISDDSLEMKHHSRECARNMITICRDDDVSTIAEPVSGRQIECIDSGIERPLVDARRSNSIGRSLEAEETQTKYILAMKDVATSVEEGDVLACVEEPPKQSANNNLVVDISNSKPHHVDDSIDLKQDIPCTEEPELLTQGVSENFDVCTDVREEVEVHPTESDSGKTDHKYSTQPDERLQHADGSMNFDESTRDEQHESNDNSFDSRNSETIEEHTTNKLIESNVNLEQDILAVTVESPSDESLEQVDIDDSLTDFSSAMKEPATSEMRINTSLNKHSEPVDPIDENIEPVKDNSIPGMLQDGANPHRDMDLSEEISIVIEEDARHATIHQSLTVTSSSVDEDPSLERESMSEVAGASNLESLMDCVDNSANLDYNSASVIIDTECEHIDSSTTFSKDMTVLKEPPASSSITGDTEEKLTESKLEYIEGSSDTREEHSVMVEEASQIIKYGHDGSKSSVKRCLSGAVLVRVNASTDLRENVLTMEETSLASGLEHAESIFDLREETSILKLALSDAALERADSDIDLRDEFSITHFDDTDEITISSSSEVTSLQFSSSIASPDCDYLSDEALKHDEKTENRDISPTNNCHKGEIQHYDADVVEIGCCDDLKSHSVKDRTHHQLIMEEKDLDVEPEKQKVSQELAENTSEEFVEQGICTTNCTLSEDSELVDHRKVESATEREPLLCTIEATNDEVRITMSPPHDKACSIVSDERTASQTTAMTKLPPDVHNPAMNEALRAERRSRSHCESISPFNPSLSRIHITTSLPSMGQDGQDDGGSLQPSKSAAAESKIIDCLHSSSTSVKSEIFDAHSIQLSRVSNQSRSTASSGNSSIASEAFKPSIIDSGSDSSGHYRHLHSVKDDFIQRSRNLLAKSKSAVGHSLTSQVHRATDSTSGSSDTIFFKTIDTRYLNEISKDSHSQVSQTTTYLSETSKDGPVLFPVAINSGGDAAAFGKVTEQTDNPCQGVCAIDVFAADVEHDIESPHPNTDCAGCFSDREFGMKLRSISQEMFGLHHSQNTVDLALEYSHRESKNISTLQASDSVTILVEAPSTPVQGYAEKTGDTLCHVSSQLLHEITSTKTYNHDSLFEDASSESAGHVAVTMDHDLSPELNDETLATQHSTDAKSSSETFTHSSTDYFTAHETLSSGSQGSLSSSQCAADTSYHSGSEHRDSVQHNILEQNTSNDLLKMSSSTSLFIPRGFSTGPCDNNSFRRHQRQGSTTTMYSVLSQLSDSTESVTDQDTGAVIPDDRRVYEPY